MSSIDKSTGPQPQFTTPHTLRVCYWSQRGSLVQTSLCGFPYRSPHKLSFNSPLAVRLAAVCISITPTTGRKHFVVSVWIIFVRRVCQYLGSKTAKRHVIASARSAELSLPHYHTNSSLQMVARNGWQILATGRQ